jgi:hypothetical protein
MEHRARERCHGAIPTQLAFRRTFDVVEHSPWRSAAR